MKKLLIIIIFISSFIQKNNAQIHSVLNDKEGERGEWLHYSDLNNIFHKVLVNDLLSEIEKRKESVNKIKTKEEVVARRADVKQVLSKLVGEFPEKTPLNAKSLGFIEKDFCTIERVVFESQPKLYVTSAIFKPKNTGKKKLPAILYLSGHADVAFRSETYQRVIYNLVKKGFLVMAIDPIGQGERIEYVEEKLPFEYTSNNLYHSYIGSQCMLAGQSLTKYFIWDAIRAIDYLSTRKDVDMGNLGATGRSGGGTQTAWLGVFEERLKAVAIENYMTSFEYLLKSIGLQDSEQNVNYALKNEIDFADLVLARAPKPALIIATDGDFFNIQGATNTYKELERYYALLSSADKLSWHTDVDGHTSTKKNREALYGFFNTHLGNSTDSKDIDTEGIPADQFLILDDEHKKKMFNRTVTDVNREEYLQVKKQLTKSDEQIDAQFLESLLEIKWNDGPFVKVKEVKYKDFTVEKYFVESKEYPLPFLVAKPAQPNNQLILQFSTKGKQTIEDAKLHDLIEKGYTIVLTDLLGVGELGKGDYGGTSIPMTPEGVPPVMWFTANQSERSILGRWISDMKKVLDFADDRFGNYQKQVWASNYLTVPALHLPKFTKSIEITGLYGMLYSWESLITHKFYDPAWMVTTIPGITLKYDIPDLIKSYRKENLKLYATVNQRSSLLGIEEMKDLGFDKFLPQHVVDDVDEYEALFNFLEEQ